ncbi:PREDICTED: pentatricopeptide [Prunus dulcis]|uniref:PREDICTED: pentatricopeptide n=1 Tax=Prunus dulcis TaxID=3755 RepID=A0A5E4EX29_PRUDU|nr:PREDICTED: pentatricopeptide [Prunus dulcis]
MTDARNVYHSLKHSFRPNLQTFNIFLSRWKSSGEAEGFYTEMREMGVEPDIISYNCFVDVYCKSREIDKAYKVVEQMRDENISPDVFTYTSIIGGLGLVGQPDKARDVLKEMNECGCYPDVAAYNAAIRNFCIAKRLGDAYGLMDAMMRCLPNTQSCMFLIRLFRRQEKADMALQLKVPLADGRKGHKPSNVSFRMIKVLMELANKHEALKNLTEKMAVFGSSIHLMESTKSSTETSHSECGLLMVLWNY